MPLATHSQRLRAKLIDAALYVAPYFMLQAKDDAGWIVCGLIVALALLCVQAWLLTKDGQSIGKRALGIKIVRSEVGGNGGFVTNVLVRGVVASIPNAIPMYWIVDSLFVFRRDRRCIHDLIAGTRVVAATLPPAASSAA
jgi:uncharacterized RDD family membrane protein YckC